VGIPAVPAYSAAKSGVHGLSRNIAIDYGGHGIRSNTIVVGLIRDELTEALYAAPGMDKAVASLQMLPKQGVPEDITKLALYLASDDSSFVTAQEIRVDGGLTLKGGLQGNVVDLAFDDAADRARG
jgi:NAD(P)-dependent dehydrogenase (short-subunit alcohol dehydrogenase family)